MKLTPEYQCLKRGHAERRQLTIDSYVTPLFWKVLEKWKVQWCYTNCLYPLNEKWNNLFLWMYQSFLSVVTVESFFIFRTRRRYNRQQCLVHSIIITSISEGEVGHICLHNLFLFDNRGLSAALIVFQNGQTFHCISIKNSMIVHHETKFIVKYRFFRILSVVDFWYWF